MVEYCKEVMQKKIVTLLFLLLISTTAVAQTVANSPDAYSTELTAPVVITQDMTSLVKGLEEQNVQVIQEGDNLRIIIPTDIYFEPLSVQICQAHLDTWAAITQLLRYYDARHMTIEGHTDNVGSLRSKLNRSYLMAHNVSAYLWANGIPLYRMRVVGCADLKPVASNKNSLSSQMNRRIEILIS